MLRDEASITSSLSLGGLEGTFVRYWDENATVAVLEFKVEQPVAAPAATKEKEKKNHTVKQVESKTTKMGQKIRQMLRWFHWPTF